MTKHATGKVSTQTQRLVLKVIYDFDDWMDIETTQAAKLLGKPKFTAMRAFDELESIDPDLVKTERRVRWLTPGAGRKAFLEKVSPYHFNPAIREYRLNRQPAVGHLPLSGLSAVGYYAGLEESPFPAFAITREQEKDLCLKDGKDLVDWEQWDSPACIVHVMRYELDSMKDTAIDPLSAILSLSDEELQDPRIKTAAEEVLRGVIARRYH